MAFFIEPLKTRSHYINVHSHHSQAGDEISILNVPPAIEGISAKQFISTGIHPWYIHQFNISETLDHIRSSVSNKNVLAIGECGLDKLTSAPFELQEQIFIEQLKIAQEFEKPVIIHCVKAFNELVRIKKENKITVPMIVHGFNSNIQISQQLLKAGLYLSFGKALFISESNAQKVLKTTGIERIFLETDDSDLSIKSIFEKAAELKEMNVETLKEKLYLNFKTIFKHE